MTTETTRELIDRIFKEPGIKYELTEFETLGKPIHEILSIYPKTVETGREAGKTKYYLKSFVPFSSGKEEVQVHVEGGKSAPEEIVRQLWIYKLIHQYDYQEDEIDLEKSVQFGTEVGTKAADIIVYTDSTKETPKIIVECKKPKRKDGIEQLKSYMNAKGAPVAVWSNGSDSIILYRPYPKEFDDTLFDIPRRGQQPKDVLEAKKTLLQLRKVFNFKKIIQDLEELVLADSGKDEFNEIFKLIFAKIWDEREAQENRKSKVVEFRKALDPDITFDRINALFHKAAEEWPGIFRDGEDIELTKRHLQVIVGPIEGVRLMGANLRVMDDAFEYLLAAQSKKKKGQFFTPRHVVEMCVRMLNPKNKEYVMDPACGSAGFLLHAMDWCYPARDVEAREMRKFKYASEYLWGIDFETRAAKTSRALMLIAGDGHTNIFGPDVSSLDPKTWYETGSGQALMQGLRQARLTVKKIPENEKLKDEDYAWEYFEHLKFDSSQFDEYTRSEVRLGDIVIAIGGYIGPLGIISDVEDCRININRHLARISADSELIDPYFLAAYLACNISQALLRREIRGAVQAGINLADLKLHPVFVPSERDQENIADKMRRAENLLFRSREDFSDAQHLLECELDLDKLSFQKSMGYMARFSTVRLSDTFDASRIDAQCFAPNALFHKNWLLNHAQCDHLFHLLKRTVKGKQQDETASGSINYCSIKHISNHALTGATKCQPTGDIPLASQHDLLLAITGATIGKIGIIKRYNKLAFSGDLLCLRTKPEINPHYLLVVLDHSIGQVQFNRWITGSTNGHLAPRDVGRVLVPRIGKSNEDRIAELVEESLNKRVESEKLLDQAKIRVEQLIEEAVRQ